MKSSAFRRGGRLPALLLTALLHAGLLAVLVYSFQRFAAPPRNTREAILRLPRLIEPAPATIDARGRRRAAPDRSAPPQFIPPANPPGTAAGPDIRALGRALFNCAPETYASLSPEQRARCTRPGEALAMLPAPDLMGTRSHVKDTEYWREELAREQSNVILPCMGGRDIICVLKVIATADLSQVTDPRKWPRYDVAQIPPEDFKKIEQAYDDWHRAHRANASQGHLAPAH